MDKIYIKEYTKTLVDEIGKDKNKNVEILGVSNEDEQVCCNRAGRFSSFTPTSTACIHLIHFL